MLPEVEEYFAKQGEYDNFNVWSERAKVDEANPMPEWAVTMSKEDREAYYAAEVARVTGYKAVEHRRREILEAALEALRNSNDPLVKWIAENDAAWQHYPDHVRAVLRALPMSREEMETFGADQSWCREYNRFLERAEQAGVLPAWDETYNDVDVTPMVDEFTKWYGATADTRRIWERMIRKHIGTVLENARKAEAKKLEELANSQQAEPQQNEQDRQLVTA